MVRTDNKNSPGQMYEKNTELRNKLLNIELSEEQKAELEELRNTHRPRCPHCHKPYKNAYDSIQNSIIKYLWELDCDCQDKNIRIGLG